RFFPCLLPQQDTPGSSAASSPSPRKKRPPYSHIFLSDRKPSAGNLLAATFGIADPDSSTQSLPLIHEKEKEHARLIVDRPEIRDPQAGFEALGGRCESCGPCTESCLKKLGLEHDDGSHSPSSISPKSEKMYSFFEKSLSLVSPSPSRLGDHLTAREKRSQSLATPAAMANVVQFQQMHERHAEEHLVRTVNMATSNAVLSRITARLKAVASTSQQESVEEVDEDALSTDTLIKPGSSEISIVDIDGSVTPVLSDGCRTPQRAIMELECTHSSEEASKSVEIASKNSSRSPFIAACANQSDSSEKFSSVLKNTSLNNDSRTPIDHHPKQDCMSSSGAAAILNKIAPENSEETSPLIHMGGKGFPSSAQESILMLNVSSP
ncbi:hypothetical protein SK128_018183, partial [Halocaridina rubra]